MGQAGAQREPSMEEILASIRRIIENNDPADAVPADQMEHHEEPDSQDDMQLDSHDHVSRHQAVTDDHSEDDDDGEALSYETGPQPVDAAAHESVSAGPNISLADVAARVRAAPEAGSAHQILAETPKHSDAPKVGVTIPTPVNDDLAARIDDAVAEELRQALVSDEPVDMAARDVPTAGRSAVSDMSAANEVAKQTHAEDRDRAPVAAQGGQLVSLHTGEKVAAAFGELSAAVAAGQTRSFDEIAEEMLKPMLTQWLDDNLPTLVERLVREEIERVSRGNRG